MKKILIGVIVTIVVVAFLVPVILGKTDASSTNEKNQKRVDKARLVNAEKERKYIENRILGISHLTPIFANTDATFPAALRGEALDDLNILSTTKTDLEAVITFLDEGNNEAADSAYQLIESKTHKVTIQSRERRNKIRNDFRAALSEKYQHKGVVYTEFEWEMLKRKLKGLLIDRDTQVSRRAYLMQPADNAQFYYLQDQLEALGETELQLFFYKLHYEVVYQLLKNDGSASFALDYGVALQRFTDDNERVIEVLEDPVNQLMNNPTVDVARFSEPLKAYLSALRKQGKAQEFERFTQTIVGSIKNNMLGLDKKVQSTNSMPALIPYVRANLRIVAAKSLYELGIIDEAVLMIEDAKTFYQPLDTNEIAEVNALIEEYQQSSKE